MSHAAPSVSAAEADPQTYNQTLFVHGLQGQDHHMLSKPCMQCKMVKPVCWAIMHSGSSNSRKALLCHKQDGHKRNGI